MVRDIIMSSHNKSATLWLFVLGLFSETKVFVFGCLAISEIIVFAAAPFLFMVDYHILKRDHFLSFIWMAIGMMAALFISSWYNHTAFPFVFKSFAVMYGVVAYFIVFHRLLRGNYAAIKWLFIGAFISSIITIFALNPSAVVTESGYGYMGSADLNDLVVGPLFWTSKLKALFNIFLCGYYFETPLALLIAFPVVYVAVAVLTTVSGRASSLALILTAVIIIIGRKRRSLMYNIGRHLWMFMACLVLVLICAKYAYQYTASNGLLGEGAQRKYEAQTKHGNSILSMLMAGRTEFFVSFRAVFDKPILGHGPRAEDTNGYWMKFVSEYGDERDILSMQNSLALAAQHGQRVTIPSHSHIMGGWLHYGIFGFIFYAWILLLIYQHFKRHMGAIPQWYGFFASFVPYYMWNIFFSPFGSRWMFAILMTCIFYARAIGRGYLQLPIELEMQARSRE